VAEGLSDDHRIGWLDLKLTQMLRQACQFTGRVLADLLQ
jgi:hypothetical protein